MSKKDCKLKVTGSILLFLFILSSVSLFFFPQANNNLSKDETIEISEELRLSATYWTTTEVVSTESTGYSSAPTIAVDGAGNAHVAWWDSTNYGGSGTDYDIFYKRWNATSGTWTTTEVVSTESTRASWYPTIVVDGTGSVHVAWDDHTNYDGSGTDYDIFYKRWNATSGTWTTTEVVSTESTSSSSSPTIAVDGTGNVHVGWGDSTWGDSGTDRDIFYKRWNATSSTWTTTEVVSTESTGDSSTPTIAVDGAGNAHMAWWDDMNYEGSGTDYDIFYKRWNATSGTWTTTEVVSTESTSDSTTSTIAMDGAGNVHVVWQDWTNYGGSGTGYNIFYKRWNVTSSTWTTTEVVSTESAPNSEDPTIAVDVTMSVHVAWKDSTDYDDSGTDRDIFYKRWNATSGTWTTTEVISTESTSSSSLPTIAVDSAMSVHVAWADSTDYDSSGTDSDIFYMQPNPLKINSPTHHDYFGSIAPSFNISVRIFNLDTLWYTLDDGITIVTFSGFTGTIDQTKWDKKGHGAVTIRFYANNSFGREGYAEVVINKDLNPPTSLLSFIPHRGINEVNISTTFILTADDGLGSGVSVIKYKINNSAWTDYTGLFNLSTFLTGDYIISYYAIDAIGNIEVKNTLLVKLVEFTVQEPLPDMTIIILTASIIGGIGLAIVITIILIKKRK